MAQLFTKHLQTTITFILMSLVFFVPVGKAHIESTTPQVLYFLEGPEGSEAVINRGEVDHMEKGTLLETYRNMTHEGETRRKTGKLKIIKVWRNHALAEIVDSGQVNSKIPLYKRYGVMAGDIAVKPDYKIGKTAAVLPLLSLSYDELFIEPNAFPTTFELSLEGKKRLTRAAAQFSGRRLSRLFINGHTDAEGDTEANQIESYQRAITVRQFLIGDLAFDATRLTALGFGESDLADKSNVLGQKSNNRRIELKASTL